MAKDKADEFIEILVDAIMGKQTPHPSEGAVNMTSKNFHFLVGLKWDKLFQEYKDHTGCHIKGCVLCAFAYRQNMRLLKFIRAIVEPHRPAYIELVNEIRVKNEAFERLQSETHSQNRKHN